MSTSISSGVDDLPYFTTYFLIKLKIPSTCPGESCHMISSSVHM